MPVQSASEYAASGRHRATEAEVTPGKDDVSMSFVGECRLWLQSGRTGSSSIKVSISKCVGECRLWPQSATEAEVAPARGDVRPSFIGECRFWLQSGRVRVDPPQKLSVQGASRVPLAPKCDRGRSSSSRQRRCQCEIRRVVPPLAAKRPSELRHKAMPVQGASGSAASRRRVRPRQR